MIHRYPKMVTVKLEIPNDVADLAREVAATTHRRVEDVLVEWLGRASSDVPVDNLSNEQVLVLANMQMDENEQEELNHLLDLNREGLLNVGTQARFDELMDSYRRGLVRKSEALRVAVQRGLRPPLG